MAGVRAGHRAARLFQFASLAQDTVTKSIGNVRIPVASIDDLIALKRAAGRAIDLADIEALGRLKQLGLDR
jgi:hypothetical protein